MKNRINQILLLYGIGILATLSCNKNKLPDGHRDWSITGRILEYNSEIGIPDATVRIMGCTTEFLGSTTCLTKETVLTDADGRYTFSYTGEESNMYIDVDVPNTARYIPFGNPRVVNQTDLGLDFDLEVFARSWLDLKISNTRNDSIIAAIHIQSPDYPSTFDLKLESKTDTSFKFNMTAGKEKRIFYHVKNHIGVLTESYKDTIICPPHDTLFHIISY